MTMADRREELTQTLDQASWEWLSPHADRDAIIVVAPQLDLVAVGLALVEDQARTVQHWIDEQLLMKPSPEQKIQWAAARDQQFMALIVQPYVLIQLLE
jgi:hypothetical protein